MNPFLRLLLFVSVAALSACNNTDASTDSGATDEETGAAASAPVIGHSITASLPHDTSAFTQGLVVYNGTLLEGTGLVQRSKLRQLDLKTGNAVKEQAIDPQLFGEGITVLRDTLYQLTYQDRKVLVYTAKDFKKIKEFGINTEGWGITNDGKNLIVSDGTSNLYFYEPGTFRLLSTQSVTENGSLVNMINELEFIDGFVYANRWMHPYILKIDPASGQVSARIDLTELVQRVQAQNPQLNTESEATLNGIAYDPQTKKTYITGKLWPQIYEIEFAR